MFLSLRDSRRVMARLGLACALLAAVCAGAFSSGTARAFVPVQSINAYSQNFDSLIQSGSAPWQNDTTLPGWYATAGSDDIATYNSFVGTANSTNYAGGLYSFGDGNDRALGTISSSPGGSPKRIGVVLRNTTGVTITEITVAYKGEQWVNSITSTLQFKYQTGTNLGLANLKTSSNYRSVAALNFVTPKSIAAGTTTPAGPVDGNLPENSKVLSATINIPNVGPGGDILLAWEQDNKSGNDPGLAVDDLSVTASLSPNAPVQSACQTPITTNQGIAARGTLSASDADDIVNSASIAVSPANAGITLGNQTPATTAGGTYTATLAVAPTVPQGTYNVNVKFSNQHTPVQTATCAVQVVVGAPLPTPNYASSTLTVAPNAVNIGGVFTYTMAITNTGGKEGDYAFNDTLPSAVQVVSLSPGLTQSGQTIAATGTIAASQRITYTIAVRATAAGTVNNSATLSGDGTTRPLFAPPVTVREQSTPADFSGSTLAVSAAQAKAGDQLTYTITVANSGQLANNFALSDTLDPNVTLIGTPTGGLTVNGRTLSASGQLNGGASHTYTFTVQINANVSANTVISNNATINTNGGQTKTLSASTTVTAPPSNAPQVKVYLPMVGN